MIKCNLIKTSKETTLSRDSVASLEHLKSASATFYFSTPPPHSTPDMDIHLLSFLQLGNVMDFFVETHEQNHIIRQE